jgi:adenosine deaminase CECR1
MLDAVENATKLEDSQQKGYNLVCGFDLVNEEDYNYPIDYFLEQILITKQRMGDKFQVYFHAGESYSSANKELYDAVLLGSKRIGHGFALAKSKSLIELVKEKNICIECCPISNRILGYCYDLRCHPTRGLLAQGVKVSLSPDD